MMNYVEKINVADKAVKICRINVNAAARNIREIALNNDSSTYSNYEQTVEELLKKGDSELEILKGTNVISESDYNEYAAALSAWEDIGYSINEIEIILVVFDKRSFQLSGQIVGDIDSYIDANYVRESHRKEYPVRSRSNARMKELSEESFYGEMLQREAEDNYPLEEDTGLAQPAMLSADISLEDQLANIGVSFHDKLFELIDKAHIDNKDVWKRANLDRKHFSKIQCDQNYHPKKKTVMALCIALQLDLEQSKDLLARADWAFSPSSKVDLIVQKAIIYKQYDIMQLNVTLFKYTNEILGV